MKPVIKKTVLALVKFILIGGIFVFLFWRAAQGDAFHELIVREKNWNYLLPGFFINLAAVVLTFVRWRWLVEALGVPLSFFESIRIGFIGFIFNLSPVGIVGGDVVKTCILAKRQREKTMEVAASVIVDRVIGLYVMFLIGFVAIFSTGFLTKTQYEARFASTAIILLTIVSTLFVSVILFPDSKHGYRLRLIRSVPLIGTFLAQVTESMQVYRNRKKVLFVSALATIGVHLFFSVSLYCFAMGLFGFSPTVGDHLVLYPVANTGSMIPLSAGPLEYFLDTLYPLFTIPGHENYQLGFGMVLGLFFRFVSLLVAGIGVLYYLGVRAEVSAALEQKEDEPQSQDEAVK